MSIYSRPTKVVDLSSWFNHFLKHRAIVFTLLILTALLAFELFNYSTTQFALMDLLGKMEFAGMKWATILAIAFCGIDFAGIARLFTPEKNGKEPTEVWYLFGAWFLAATMNAILTWWGVSMDLASHPMQSTSVIDGSLLLKGVPIFVAVMVWLIRILIIGTLSYASDRMTGSPDRPARQYSGNARTYTPPEPVNRANLTTPRPSPALKPGMSPTYKNQPDPIRSSASFSNSAVSSGDSRESLDETNASRPEPVYQDLTSGRKTTTSGRLF